MKIRAPFLSSMLLLAACVHEQRTAPAFDKEQTARKYYGEDYKWYVNNIPFFECSDTVLQNVYYYRWKLYKAHLRSVGHDKYVVTEFINHVPWDRDPYCTINAASMHHIYEGRWLKDDRYMNGYITNLVLEGGNNRRYSESVADAAYARYLVNADSTFIVNMLDSLTITYEGWFDHYDSSKQLYYIPAMPDATEYTIASIDASGGKDGFEGGDAFRPTLNSYMYGNAKAIARIAEMKGDFSLRDKYLERAALLKERVEEDLWNDSLDHFTDRYKVTNQHVRYWDFIRGRELAGMAPWYFNLPADSSEFGVAWKHAIDTSFLSGKFGFRTNEPSYEHYFHQFVFFEGKPGSQWNGPSWPYQSSQTLTAMANLLNNYKQHTVSNADYVRLLRLYAKQHILPEGQINLVENYHPDRGGPIVYYYWSNHYLHSTFNNLVISGLCGVRPSNNDSLEINPLVDSTINYFLIDSLNYHGHVVTVVYDRTGDNYGIGKGLNVFVNGEHRSVTGNKVYVDEPASRKITRKQPNVALNINKKGYPKPSASVNYLPDTSLYQAVDGRVWYFPEIINYWSTRGSSSPVDWFVVEMAKPTIVSSVDLALFADQDKYSVPDSVKIEYRKSADEIEWRSAKLTSVPTSFTSNTNNLLRFDPVKAVAVKLLFYHQRKDVAVSEIEIY